MDGAVVPIPEMKILNRPVFEMYRDPDTVLPELLGLGFARETTPRFGGPRPDGRDAWEIGYLEQGAIEWMTPDGLEEAGPGSVLVDPPGEWLGGRSALLHPCVRYWLRFNVPPQGSLPGLAPERVAALATAFGTIRRRSFAASPDIRPAFERLLAAQRAGGPFAADLARAALHQILFQVVLDHARDPAAALARPTKAALAYLDAHAATEVSGAALAAAANVSVGYLYDLFQRDIGMAPGQYHARRRMALAKRQLIATEASVTDIALSLGFSSSQYFATTFKKIVGMTPVAYRRLRERS